MKFQLIAIGTILTICSACSNFEDKELTSRNTFARFYGSDVSYLGAIAVTDNAGGYIIGANIPRGEDDYDILIIKTDENGKTIWDSIIENGFVRSIKSTDNGYLIVGDRIEIDRSAPLTEIVNTQAWLIQMDFQGTITNEFIKRELTVDGLEIDFSGSALNLDASGNILLLGSFKRPEAGNFETSFVESIAPGTFTTDWSQTYALLQRSYINCPSLHITTDQKLLWASSSLLEQQSLQDSYVSISFVSPNSTFENNSKFGENDTRSHEAQDIQRSSIGYGVIGTYQEANGANANIFFLRIDNIGNVVENSMRYFDGHSESILISERDLSVTQDEGNAITGTRDGGYVLACTVSSTPSQGNGGTDIRLIKVDGFGNFLWTQLIGGTGDESPSSIRETSDGGLLICGSSSVNALSSVMLIKTDRNGLLTN